MILSSPVHVHTSGRAHSSFTGHVFDVEIIRNLSSSSWGRLFRLVGVLFWNGFALDNGEGQQIEQDAVRYLRIVKPSVDSATCCAQDAVAGEITENTGLEGSGCSSTRSWCRNIFSMDPEKMALDFVYRAMWLSFFKLLLLN